MTRTFATWTAAVILLLGIAALGVVANGASPAGTRDVCAGLDSGKIDTVGDPATVTMTAPPPALITEYCIKAGSAQSGGGPVYVPVDPPVASITIGHPTGKAVSHFSFSYEKPADTTTTGLPTTTTVPETTTTVPEVTTTVPETTTTVVETTTTVPETTTTTTTTSEPEQTTTTSTTTTSTTTTSVQATTTTQPPPVTTVAPRCTLLWCNRTTIPATR